MTTTELLSRARRQWGKYSRNFVTDRLWPIWEIIRRDPLTLTETERLLLRDFIDRSQTELHRVVYYQDQIFVTGKQLTQTRVKNIKRSGKSAK